MSKLIEIYLVANKVKYGRYQTKEEFMQDMKNKEYRDPSNGCGMRTVRFQLDFGLWSKNKEHIQEEHDFHSLSGIYDRLRVKLNIPQ